jgi:hypothetical protein
VNNHRPFLHRLSSLAVAGRRPRPAAESPLEVCVAPYNGWHAVIRGSIRCHGDPIVMIS